MHKKFLVILTGSIALSISAVPVLASDPPTDDGQYIWQDENGDCLLSQFLLFWKQFQKKKSFYEATDGRVEISRK